nr:MAG TPA: hypothetical protein [Herelleviridae sp.]DAV70112.1 MAG TPA: hypothetical protein [Caudoviricetes sp.]
MSTLKFNYFEFMLEFFISMMYNTICKEEEHHDDR